VDKVLPEARDAVADIEDGATIAVGGFGTAGVPWCLIQALLERGTRRLTIVTNNCGINGLGLATLLREHRIERVIASYIGQNQIFAEQYLNGEIEVELNPQGTLAERLRAGGAGIAAFYTPTGVDTPVGDGGIPTRYGPGGSVLAQTRPKEVRTFVVGGESRRYVLEEAIVTDFALIRATVADRHGNATFHAAARNFNPDFAMAARTAIVEAERVVDAGEIDPDNVHLPGIFVQRVVALAAGHRP
jgi:3-oxoacid CoA-transferase subunit A